jgi:D-glycero-D-manno-heptose 1,7-bisphosphate phosphatase
MARRAAREHKLDLKRSYMIGDQTHDLIFGRRIGARSILVLTGSGRRCRRDARRWSDKISSRLDTAADWIIRDFRGR